MSCRMQINLTELSFELEGERDFIEDHYTELLKHLKKADTGLRAGALSAKPTAESTAGRNATQVDSGLDRYIEAGVFYIDGETTLPVIQAAVPGGNKREQMRNVALILLFAANSSVNSTYIKEQCERQSCLDSANFSKAYETDRRNFIKKGKAGSRDWSLELTIPGKKAAEELLESIIG